MIKGPYSLEDWYTMLLLRSELKYLKNKNKEYLKIPIKNNTKILKKYLDRVAA